MGVYIKGMEMPNKNMERCIILRFYPNGHICDENGRRYNTIPIPPHGRLIDADALMGEFEKAQRTMQQHGREYSCSFLSSSQELSTEWYCVEDIFENAPTVIEAEEGD